MMKGHGRGKDTGFTVTHAHLFMLSLVLPGCSEFGVSDQDEVVQNPITLEERFTQVPLPKLDVLWVIDNTPSMADEQLALSSALTSFTAGLQDAGVAWQVGVVKTDILDDDAGVLQGVPWVITPAQEDLDIALAAAAAVGLDGQPPEAGLGAAWLALTEPLASGLNRGFRRDDAALHIVVMSDGDDASEAILGGRPDEAFLLFLEEEAVRTGQSASLSAVVGDAPNGCIGDLGSAQPGLVYLSVAQQSGGVVQSICEPDFSAITTELGTDTIPWSDRFPLTEVPVTDSIRVAVDGERQDTGWSLEASPPAILFERPPAPGAEITVSYEVAT